MCFSMFGPNSVATSVRLGESILQNTCLFQIKYKKLLGSLEEALFDSTIATVLLLVWSIEAVAEEKESICGGLS